jgi:hypothetical protein
MSGSVNKVILVGNLGRDPEVRAMQNGGKVCNLSVATSERWKDRNTGEPQERTEFISRANFRHGNGRTKAVRTGIRRKSFYGGSGACLPCSIPAAAVVLEAVLKAAEEDTANRVVISRSLRRHRRAPAATSMTRYRSENVENLRLKLPRAVIATCYDGLETHVVA